MPAVLNSGMTLDVSTLRERFPALERRHEHYPVAYFDGPGGTQVPREVGDAITRYLFHHNANTHWLYPTSIETDALLGSARKTMAEFLNAAPNEIAFGANMTTLTFHLARALGRGWGPEDTVIVTELDHHANVAPWHALARERGVRIRRVRMNPETGMLDQEDLQAALEERASLLAIGAASNALGTITDVRAICGQAHEAGILTFVDAVHYAPHVLVDVEEIGCDFLACSPYKFYGPHIGVLFGRHELLESLDVPKLLPAPDTAPERMETGTQNHEGIVGAAAAVDFLASLGSGSSRRDRLADSYGRLHEQAKRLFGKMWSGLSGIDGITCHGPGLDAARTPTVSFTSKTLSPPSIARGLARRGVYVSHGDFYALTVIERLGVGEDGVVRAGCACYTNDEEVERLVDGVRELVEEQAAAGNRESEIGSREG